MFDDLASYYHDNVVSSYIENRDRAKNNFAGRSRDLRESLSAANALFHLREHLPPIIPTRSKIEQLCPDYGLLGDVVNASKHNVLTGNTPHGDPLVEDATSLNEQILIIEYEDAEGIYKYAAKTVVVTLNDGSERNLLEVLTNVINFWEQHMLSLGIISEARTFVWDVPLRARTRSECKGNELDFEVVHGQRFHQSVKLLRYNNDTRQFEPIDLTGKEIKLNVYSPSFDVDITMMDDSTGEEFKKTISLSESESLVFNELSTDAEKQAFLYGLPAAQEALRELANKSDRKEK